MAYPIGLITLDETALSRDTSYYKNDGSIKANYMVSADNYLYSQSAFWTLSPAFFGGQFAFVGTIHSYINSNSVNKIFGVRPCISLTSSTEVTLGDGTKEDPFVVE